jgi:hypothetical protein
MSITELSERGVHSTHSGVSYIGEHVRIDIEGEACIGVPCSTETSSYLLLPVARGHLYALAVAPDVLSDPELAALRSRVAAASAASSFSVRRALSVAAHLGIP